MHFAQQDVDPEAIATDVTGALQVPLPMLTMMWDMKRLGVEEARLADPFQR